VELAHELDFRVSETPMFSHEIEELEEFFLTGTTSDVMPVVSLDGKPVGEGKPGRMTLALYEALAARLAAVPATAGSR